MEVLFPLDDDPPQDGFLLTMRKLRADLMEAQEKDPYGEPVKPVMVLL